MKCLIIVNDPPYGTERTFNAFRLVHALLKREPPPQVTVFLLADSVSAAKANQRTPAGYYNLELMLKRIVAGNGTVLLCGTCMDARGMTAAELIEGARRSTIDELANATADADKVLVF
jgi:uncharacterized protein involved in oxidation of intracellular sulfur